MIKPGVPLSPSPCPGLLTVMKWAVLNFPLQCPVLFPTSTQHFVIFPLPFLCFHPFGCFYFWYIIPYAILVSQTQYQYIFIREEKRPLSENENENENKNDVPTGCINKWEKQRKNIAQQPKSFKNNEEKKKQDEEEEKKQASSRPYGAWPRESACNVWGGNWFYPKW